MPAGRVVGVVVVDLLERHLAVQLARRAPRRPRPGRRGRGAGGCGTAGHRRRLCTGLLSGSARDRARSSRNRHGRGLLRCRGWRRLGFSSAVSGPRDSSIRPIQSASSVARRSGRFRLLIPRRQDQVSKGERGGVIAARPAGAEAVEQVAGAVAQAAGAGAADRPACRGGGC